MKIIKLDIDSVYSNQIYNILDNILYWGAERLPFIFLKKVYFDGEKYQLPRWITKRHFDTIDRRTRKLMSDLNWG
jgi:hypothetical protein